MILEKLFEGIKVMDGNTSLCGILVDDDRSGYVASGVINRLQISS
jgi:hypothetical protein